MLSNYETLPILRWPFRLGGNKVLHFGDASTPAGSILEHEVTITDNDWIFTGTGAGAVSCSDFATEFKDACIEAYDNIFGGGPADFDVSLNDSGHIVITNNEASTLYVFGQSVIGSNTTFDTAVVGLGSGHTTFAGGQTTTSGNMCHHQWYAGLPRNRDTGDRLISNFRQSNSPINKPIYTSHHRKLIGENWVDGESYERIIEWDMIPSGRLCDHRLGESRFQTRSGLSAGEDMTLENMFRYMDSRDTSLYPQPGMVVVFPNTTGFAYQVDLEASGILLGMSGDDPVESNFEMFPVRLRLVRSG